jgi:hypothetical protein
VDLINKALLLVAMRFRRAPRPFDLIIGSLGAAMNSIPIFSRRGVKALRELAVSTTKYDAPFEADYYWLRWWDAWTMLKDNFMISLATTPSISPTNAVGGTVCPGGTISRKHRASFTVEEGTHSAKFRFLKES